MFANVPLQSFKMLASLSILASALFGLAATSPTGLDKRADSLIVTTVPDTVRPYIVRAFGLDGYTVGAQIYRFPVTGNSSGGAFSMIGTATYESSSLGVLPHVSLLGGPSTANHR